MVERGTEWSGRTALGIARQCAAQDLNGTTELQRERRGNGAVGREDAGGAIGLVVLDECLGNAAVIEPAGRDRERQAKGLELKRDRAPSIGQSTVEAILYCVRTRGLAALKEPANEERLSAATKPP